MRPDVLVFGIGLVLFGTLLSQSTISDFLLYMVFGVFGVFGAANSIDEYNDYELDLKNRKNRLICPLCDTNLPKELALIQGALLYLLGNFGLFYFFGLSGLLVGVTLTSITLAYSFSLFDLKGRAVPKVLTNVFSLTLLFLLPHLTKIGWIDLGTILWSVIIFNSILITVLCNDLKDYTVEKTEGLKTLWVIMGVNRLSKMIIFISFSNLLLILFLALTGLIHRFFLLSIPPLILIKYYYSSLMLKDGLGQARKIALGSIIDLTTSTLLFSLLIYLLVY